MEGYPRGPGFPKASNGTVILVLGILSLVMCGPILGPCAWIMGNNALTDIRRGMMDPADEGLINVGRILGIVSTCLAIVGILIAAAYLVLVGSLLTFSAPRR